MLDQVPGLLFISHHGTDLRINVHPNHVDGRRPGLQLHAKGSALADDLRLFQLHFFRRWHYHTIAGGLHSLQGIGNLVIGLLDIGKLDKQRQKLCIIFNGEPRLAAENLIVQSLRQCNGAADCPLPQIHGAQAVVLNRIQLR